MTFLVRSGIAPAFGAAAIAAIVIVTLWRVVATNDVFSHTVDEPAHIAAGAEFLRTGHAGGDLTHAPLARIAIAAGPVLLNETGQLACNVRREESLIACPVDSYWRALAAARAGTLPFLALMLLVVWYWGRRIAGPSAGLLAALLLANSPAVLAHAGLATTDVAGAATLTLALLAMTLWLEGPTWRRGVVLGVSSGLALGSKLSAVLFLPGAGFVIALVLAFRTMPPPPRPRVLFAQAGAALAACAITVWAIYGFTLNPLVGPGGVSAGGFGGHSDEVLRWKIFPLVEMLRGLLALTELDEDGLPAYFMGEIRQEGWWYFFPVMFAVKTPLPFLLLLACGGILAVRRRARALLAVIAAALAILAIGMSSQINIGLRHVIAVYALASIVGGAAAAALLAGSRPLHRAAAVLSCVWLVADVARTHPDYIPYFNELAREQAPYFSADSDLDWGQDAKRLADELIRRGIRRVHIAMNSTARLAEFKPLEAANLWPDQRVAGWVAVGMGRILVDRVRAPFLGFRWLECYEPVALIGKTVLLYNVRPDTEERPRSCGSSNLAVAGG